MKRDVYQQTEEAMVAVRCACAGMWAFRYNPGAQAMCECLQCGRRFTVTMLEPHLAEEVAEESTALQPYQEDEIDGD
jgi:hypothetical protein